MRIKVLKAKATWTGTGFWALGDQCVVSLGMFLTNLALARQLQPAEYGVYSLFLATSFFLNGVHASLVTYPLSVYGAASSPDRLRWYAGTAISLTFMLAVPLSLLLAVIMSFTAHPPALPWSLTALVSWQTQETIRRALMAGSAYRKVLWGDAISYMGQAAVLWGLVGRVSVTVDTALAVMVATSLVAGALQIAQLRPDPMGLLNAPKIVVESWRMSRWVLLSTVCGTASITVLFWTLSFVHTSAETASFQALVNVVAVAHPVLFGLGNVLIPAAARSNSLDGKVAALRSVRKLGIQAGVLLIPYLLLLLLWPTPVLRMFYGISSSYSQLQKPLRMLAASYVFAFFAQLAGGLLSGLRETRAVFVTQACGTAAAVLVGLPLMVSHGVGGACIAHLGMNLARAGLGGFFVAASYRVREHSDGELHYRLIES